MFKIHEFSSATGELSSVWLRVHEEVLEIVTSEPAQGGSSSGDAWQLPHAAVHAVLARFGAPFDDDARISEVARLELGDGEVLRHVRHLAGYDVIARDYIVYENRDGERLCALATTVSAALLHVARASRAVTP